MDLTMANTGGCDLIVESKTTCRLNIGNGAVVYHLCCDPPNWWHRMWQRLLLGFKWTTLR